MRILVLVLGARTAPYPALMRVIRRTWASTSTPGTETLFYYGRHSLRLHGRELALPVADDLSHAGHKTIACFEYVLGHFEFDLVFRTNCSSYVDLPNLRAFALTRARQKRFYAGLLGGTRESGTFASGSGYFLSRDLVELVVRQQSTWDHGLLDDVALGALLARNSVDADAAPRQDITSVAGAEDVDTSQFHFRCRTDSRGRLEDARIMIALHRAFCEARGLAVARELRALEWIGGHSARLLAHVGTSP